MKKRLLATVILLNLLLAFSNITAQDYYVSALTGSNNNDGQTPATALATIAKGAEKVSAGGTVYIMNGTYSRTTFGSVLDLKKSGTADAYITFKPYAGHSPLITASEGSWEAMVIDGSYVVIDGLELQGNNANITYSDAYQAYQDYINKIKGPQAKFNTNGISLGKSTHAHHIIIRNCKVHDFPGGGIGGGKIDYVTIEGNTVYNNAWYMMYAGSGISILDPEHIDVNTGYKIIIRNNIVYGNKTTVPWERTKALSDGNGIILDVNQATATKAAYIGRSLVENNVSYNNGGGGIHAYKADRVDIINNTAYNNGTVVGYPEIDGQSGTDIRIYNNIMYARTGGNCNLNDPGATYNYNVYYNGPFFRQGVNDVVVNPEFVNLAKDGTADFSLKSTSPVVNTGSNTAGQFSITDISGIARPNGSRPDKGAYEYQSGTQSQTITFNALPAGKKAGDADLDPGAIASSGLQVIYKSSNLNVATIVDGKIRFENEGTASITASQNGDATYNNAPDVTRTLTVLPDGFRVADLPLSVINGLNYSYYEGTWSQLPNFNTLTAVKTGITNNIDLLPRQREDNFAFRFIGYIDVPANGLYTFYTSSDDGSSVYIGDVLVVNNDGVHTEAEQSGTIGLKKGKHLITINYFNSSLSKALTVSYSSSLIPKTVIPATAFFRSNPNLVPNSTFDVNTTGWILNLNGGSSATVSQVDKAGYSGKAAKISITTPGGTLTNIQFRTNVPLVKDYTYAIRFKASADAARNIDFLLQMDASPFSNNFSRFGQPITITPTYYTFTFTAPRTDATNLIKFNVGQNVNAVYIDEVEVVRVFSPEMIVKQEATEIIDNTGTYSFGDVTMGGSKKISFTIENTGINTLNLTGNPTITVAGSGFSLVKDAPAIIDVAGNATFEVEFRPDAVKAFTGIISIANNDFNENPYNFAITAAGIKKDQTVTFADPANITYGDTYPVIVATASSNLPVTYTVISGPGSITAGNTVTYTGAGDIVVEAAQAGDGTYNAAIPVQKTFTIKKKELLVTANDESVTYGDPVPAYSYTITGFAFNETATSFTGNPELTSTYTPATPHTETPVISCSPGTLSAANYSFKTADGKITIIPLPEIDVRQAATGIASNGSYDIGEVTAAASKTVIFTIENTGFNTLNLAGSPRVMVTGEGFSLVADAPASIDASGNATFEITLQPGAVGDFTGAITIASNDRDENPYTFSLTGKAVKANQSITFNSLPDITYGEGNITLNATSTSGLPVAYTVVNGPGSITGNTLSYSAAGAVTIKAMQEGNNYYHGASEVLQTLVVHKKQLMVTADNKTVTYGDPVPAFTYTVTGFVFNETTASLTGSPALSSSYSPSTPATESLVIACSAGSLSAANYSFTTVNGQVKINHTFPHLLEAELAKVNGGSIVNIFSGYTGTGYVDHVNKAMDYVEWSANLSGASMCTLKFRYALNNPSQALSLTVNGSTVSVSVPFTNTGSWQNWGVASVQVYLNAGINKIRLNGDGIAGPNFDHLQIESDIYQSQPAFVTNAVSSPVNASGAMLDNDIILNDIKVYPIPATSDLKVTLVAKNNEKIFISIIDMQGRMVYSKWYVAGNGNNTIPLNVGKLGQGTYVLKLNSSGVVKTKVIMVGR